MCASSAEVARVAFIGCGRFATEAIYPSLRYAPLELVAVCSRTAEKAERTARQFGAGRWYTDYRALLDSEDLHGVFVITGPEGHPAIVQDVLRSGRHVFVEKPPALSLREARHMLEASQRAGRFCQVGFMKRFAPAYRAARDIVRESGFGAPRQVIGKYSGAATSTDSWRFCIGMTIHYADLLRFFMGDVDEVTAYTHDARGLPVTSALLHFTSGAAGLLSSGGHLDWQGDTEYLEVAGDGGQVAVENTTRLWHAPRAADPGVMLFPGTPARRWEPNYTPIGAHNHTIGLLGYIGEVRHFADCLLQDREPEVTIHDGYEAMRLCQALCDSRGRPVRVRDVE